MFQNGYGQSLGQWGDLTYIPNLYNIFYTFTVNEDVWNSLTFGQRAGIERAMEEVEKSAFGYQIDGLLVKQGLMQEQDAQVHYQTKAEKAAWKAFFAPSIEAWHDFQILLTFLHHQPAPKPASRRSYGTASRPGGCGLRGPRLHGRPTASWSGVLVGERFPF